MFQEDELSLLYQIFQLKATAFAKVSTKGVICSKNIVLARSLSKNAKIGYELVTEVLQKEPKYSRFSNFVNESRKELNTVEENNKEQFMLEEYRKPPITPEENNKKVYTVADIKKLTRKYAEKFFKERGSWYDKKVILHQC